MREILTGHSRAVLELARVGATYFHMVPGSGLVSTSGTRIYVKTRGRQFESSARTEREKKRKEKEKQRRRKREGTMRIPVGKDVSSIHIIRMMWYVEHQQGRVSECVC